MATVVVITGATAGVGRATAHPGDPGTHGDFDERARQHDRFAKAANWLGAAGIRGVAIAAVLGATSILSLLSLRLGRHLKMLPSPGKPA